MDMLFKGESVLVKTYCCEILNIENAETQEEKKELEKKERTR
jgi:hypothetical protein